MTNILECIENLEKRVPIAQQQVEGKGVGLITLDPKKDPDPYGNFNMALSYRLRCMGWPAGLS